ncbi:MAG TPA: polysaccharide biosynthesis tyrosine autokinase [Flavisolibacter sp.]
MEEVQISKNDASGLSIKDLFYKYIRFLPIFIICVALALLGAYIYLRYATLVYSATGTMVIQDDKSKSGSNDKFEQLFEVENIKNIQNEIEYIKSRQIMARVVEALNLNWTYMAIGNIKELNIYKSNPFEVEAFEILDSTTSFNLEISFKNDNNFTINGNGPFSFGQVVKNEYGVFKLNRKKGIIGKDYEVTWSPTRAMATSLAGIGVAPKQNTGILVLSAESTNPQLAADIVNQVMLEYQRATIEDKNASTQSRLRFVEAERKIIESQIDSITLEQLEFMKKNGVFNAEAQSASHFGQIERVTQESQNHMLKLQNVYQIESYVRNNRDDVQVPSSLGLEDPTLNDMVSAYNQAQMELKNLSKSAPPGNAALKQKQAFVNSLQNNILESLENIKRAYSSSIASLNGISASAQNQLARMPEKMQALEEISRQLQHKLEVYNVLLQEREKSAIALASTTSNIKVLTEATPNNTPVKPNRTNIRLMAIVIGLFLPALVIFILELLNDKVTTRHDIERLTEATIIGEVGHSYGKNNLVVTGNNRSVVAEQFRIIRSNLQYVLNHIQKPVILVTSSFSGEGKSFISTNIGAVMAVAGKKTVILEFDIRKPKILSHLNLQKKPGLTNYLLGKAKLEDLFITVDGSDNLFVLPCGPVPPNPAEILLDPKLNELFDYLRETFDVVIMDTAPVGMVSDAMTLSKYADATMYIVRQGHTYKKQINLIDEFYIQGKLPKISIILNDVKIRSGYGYYGYGRYGYGYGYGSGYFDDDTPPQGLLGKYFSWFDTKKWKNKRKRSKV